MRARWEIDGAVWDLHLTLDPEDPVRGLGQGSRDIGLLATSARIVLPEAVPPPHPDLEALAALVIVKPWVSARLEMRRGVSQEFADVVERLMKIEVSPIDDALEPRLPGRMPVLAYSAGFDSAAASLVLPDNTVHVHHRRVPHPKVPNRATHWRADAIERLATMAAGRGRDVRILRSDFEYLVHPFPSLPHWLGFAVGPLLLADVLDAGTLALGGTLETFYMDMGRRWLSRNIKPLGLDPLADTVGLPLMRPVLGVTEIGTMRMVLGSDLRDVARSCTYGSLTAPCGSCGKCIRKDLLTAAILGEPPASLLKLTEGDLTKAGMFGDTPLYMQAQLEYALARFDPPQGPLTALRDRLAPDAANTAWMDRVNREGLAHGVPDAWQAVVAPRLEEDPGWMTESDLDVARSWSRMPVSG